MRFKKYTFFYLQALSMSTTYKRCGIVLVHHHPVHGSQFLLVLGRKSDKWGFPKGHMEAGETEEETAIREVQEETGICIPRSRLSQTNKVRFKNNIYFIVLYDITEDGDFGQNIDFKEIASIRWFTTQELLELEMNKCNFGLSMFIKKFIMQTWDPSEDGRFTPVLPLTMKDSNQKGDRKFAADDLETVLKPVAVYQSQEFHEEKVV